MGATTPQRAVSGSALAVGADAGEALLSLADLTSLQRLTSFTAHEVRNPLAAMRAMVQLALATDDDDRRQELLRKVIYSIDDLSQFLTELVSLAGVQESMLVRLDVRPVIVEVMRLFAVQADLLNVRMTMRMPEGLPPVWGNAPLLRHAIMNLVKNSMEAMPRGGALTIAVKHLSDRNSVCIAIRDTGTGIPEERRTRLFTGVPDGRRGAGIGLPFVHHVITQVHRGTLRFESRVGVGTTFYLELLPATAPLAPGRPG